MAAGGPTAQTDPAPGDAALGAVRWITPGAAPAWDERADVVVVGAGACGLVAALAAAEAGADILVLEKSRAPGGNTNLSQGMIPAADSAQQRRAGIADSPARMAEDILRKNGGECDPERLLHWCRESAPLVEWLAERHGIPLDVVTDFNYPGFSRHRIHALEGRTGTVLVGHLRAALGRFANAQLVCNATVAALVAEPPAGGAPAAVRGVEAHIPGAPPSRVGAGAVVLACNGFGANRALLRRHIPAMADALYLGHEGNTGEGILWGLALGAAADHMGAFQAHGSVAHPHAILLTWAVIANGGFQVNLAGRRFANEYRGYSEHALDVLRQPEGIAVEVFDGRIHESVRGFEDFRRLEETGAVRRADDATGLARRFGLPEEALARTLAEFNACTTGAGRDSLGRQVFGPALCPPFFGVRVTGALLHTQGGLRVDGQARVLRPDGGPVPGLYAGGGTAAGVSGNGGEGYLSGNGLLAAGVLGRLAGRAAAERAAAPRP
jgi:fumarate reductase flavoprotein subunit